MQTLLWRYSIDLGGMPETPPDDFKLVYRTALASLLRNLACAVDGGIENKDGAVILPNELRIVWELQGTVARFGAGLVRIDHEEQNHNGEIRS